MNYAKEYQALHDQSPKIFSGNLSEQTVRTVAGLCRVHSPVRLLDYGSGKGYQYLGKRVHEHWGNILPVCYDPGVRQLRERPTGKFDGVICTDVMEHIDPDDVNKILDDIFSFVNHGKFAFFNICTRPSFKRLPDGRSVHLTVAPAEWWEEKLDRFTRKWDVVATYSN